ncbi:MAG: threonine synthase [Lysobacter sp.]
MNYFSTRSRAEPTSIDHALAAGLAPDGGLYVPERLPTLATGVAHDDLAATARAVLAPYFEESRLRDRLDELCAHAYAFPAPLRSLANADDWLLELFHGPTAAFKDFGARFLAAALDALRPGDAPAPTTILVATSGDTGAAVAAAFHRRPGFRVVILYPDGRVSPRQAHGLGCWGDNVRAYRVDGSFDDCQRLAKQALSDEALRRDVPLGSANSISLGRLLPQVAYYAHAAGAYARAHDPLNFIVPTGNLGNAAAAFIARKMGVPIGEIRLATNANDVLPRYFSGEPYTPQPSRTTLANAMDVGAPSNFERMCHWHRDDADLRAAMTASAVDDSTIRDTIRRAPTRHGVVPCPHTATGLHELERLRQHGDTRPWAVVATAHPAKFETIVEPLVGHPIDLPPALAVIEARPASAQPMSAQYAHLRAELIGA